MVGNSSEHKVGRAKEKENLNTPSFQVAASTAVDAVSNCRLGNLGRRPLHVFCSASAFFHTSIYQAKPLVREVLQYMAP